MRVYLKRISIENGKTNKGEEMMNLHRNYESSLRSSRTLKRIQEEEVAKLFTMEGTIKFTVFGDEMENYENYQELLCANPESILEITDAEIISEEILK
jgi:hypothetical protein